MLSAIRTRISTLFLLYLVQGIPYGLQARFLPIYLRSRKMSLTHLGFFKILLIPWALKVLWAPLVDKFATKRVWLLASLAALTLSCVMTSCINPSQLMSLGAVVFCLNLSASTQDIAVDGVVIQILTPKELGAGNTVQVVGYKFGAILGGGMLVWLIEYTGWTGLFIILATFYLVTFLAVLQIDNLKPSSINKMENLTKLKDSVYDHEVDRNSDFQPDSDELRCRNNVHLATNSPKVHTKELVCSTCSIKDTSLISQEVVKNQVYSYRLLPKLIESILQTQYSIWTICYVIVYKLGEQGAVGMFPLFLVDHGIPPSEVTMWTGFIGQGLSIAGSLLGGWLLSMSNLTPFEILPTLFGLRLIPMIIETISIGVSIQYGVIHYGLCLAMMCLLQLIGGAITTATFTLMMQCSQCAPAHIQATHYTALATLEVIGKLSFMSVIGLVTDWLGYFTVFCFFLGLSLFVFPLFKFRNTPCTSKKCTT